MSILRDYGLTDFEAEFQTRPDKFVGTIEDGDRAEAAILDAINASGLDYVLGEGEGTLDAPSSGWPAAPAGGPTATAITVC